MKKISFSLIILSTLIILSGCTVKIDGDIFKDDSFDNDNQPIEIGELKTYSESYNLEGQKSLDVNINLNAAKVNLEKTEDKLFEGNIKTNIAKMTPNIKLNGNNLYIGDKYEKNWSRNLSNAKNTWDLKLTDKIPLNLDIEMNATKNNFDFTDMIIDKISLDLNAADNKLTFNNINKGNLKEFDIDLNAGSLEIEGLGNAGAYDINAEVNACNIEFNFDKNIHKDVSLKIESNVSNSTVRLPNNVGFKLKIGENILISNIDKNGFDYSKTQDKTYISNNYDDAKYKVNIVIEGNMSNFDIKGF